MLGTLRYYIEPVVWACTLFPLIAGLFTLPFVIANYRRYGGIAVMRVMVVYSFILYLMCAYLLTVLPLPSLEAVEAMAPHPIGWVPFRDLYIAAGKAGLSFSNLGDAAAWKQWLTCDDMFQYLANVVMLMPLGFYLRYYFRRDARTTALIGLALSLFFELTQLTGLYFIYPRPYRFTQVDDLTANTLGAVLGWALTPILALVLPSREEIDRISYEKGEHVTVVRRAFAALIDVLAFALLLGVGVWAASVYKELSFTLTVLGLWTVYFVLIPWISRGRTGGQALLKLRTVAEDGTTPAAVWQLAWRNLLLYGAELLAVFVCGGLLAALALLLAARTDSGWGKMLLLDACLILPVTGFVILLRSQDRGNALPHSRWSRTKVISTR